MNNRKSAEEIIRSSISKYNRSGKGIQQPQKSNRSQKSVDSKRQSRDQLYPKSSDNIVRNNVVNVRKNNSNKYGIAPGTSPNSQRRPDSTFSQSKNKKDNFYTRTNRQPLPLKKDKVNNSTQYSQSPQNNHQINRSHFSGGISNEDRKFIPPKKDSDSNGNSDIFGKVTTAGILNRNKKTNSNPENKNSSIKDTGRDKNDTATKNNKSSGGKHKKSLIKNTVEAPKANKSIKKKRSFLSTVSLVLLLVIVSFGSIVGAISYGIYKDSSQTKVEDNAYKQGVKDSIGQPNVQSVVKIPDDQIAQIITTTPGASFPNNVKISNIKLQGWVEPGGQIKEGKAALSMCYVGDGIKSPLKASAFIVSDDASIPNPQWSVDSISVTGDKCSQK